MAHKTLYFVKQPFPILLVHTVRETTDVNSIWMRVLKVGERGDEEGERRKRTLNLFFESPIVREDLVQCYDS